MHSLETRKRLHEAWKAGKNQSDTSRELTIPRATVRDYFKKFSTGEYPNWHRGAAQTRLDLFHCGFESHLAYQYLYLLGMYLGDGHITKMKTQKNGNSNYKLRIFLDSKYSDIIERTKKAVEVVLSGNKALTQFHGTKTCTCVYAYSNELLVLFPQHGPGRKHDRKISLQTWQQKLVSRNPKPFIKGLIESDGCRYVNRIGQYEYPSYNFTNHSEDLHSIFAWACAKIGVKVTRCGKNSQIRTRKSVAVFDEFIGPKT